MGFCGFIGNVCSSLGHAISSGFKAVCSGIGAIGKVTMGALTLPMGIIGSAVRGIAGFVERFCGKPKEEQPEEIGEKVMISDKKPENFNSINDYIKHLREDIKVDEGKMANLSEEERLERKVLGTSVYMKQIEENFNTKLPIGFFETVGRLKLDSSDMRAYIEAFKKNNIDDMGKMNDYLKGKLDSKDVKNVGKAIKEGTKEAQTEKGLSKTVEEINADILKMQALLRGTEI